MAEKRLKQDSEYEPFDLDGDGIVSDGEISQTEKMLQLKQKKNQVENQDKREDSQRKMAWFALFGMLLYPFAVVIAVWIGLDEASKILGTMAATYFVSVAAIVAAFFGTQAYVNKN